MNIYYVPPTEYEIPLQSISQNESNMFEEFPTSLSYETLLEEITNKLSDNSSYDIEPITTSSEVKLFDVGYRLLEINNLKENWDDFGGVPLDSKAINNAIQFINKIPDEFISLIDIEDIFPNPHGTITFEWYNNNDFVSLEIGNNYANYFLKKKSKNLFKTSEHQITLDDSSIQKIFEFLTILYN